MASCQLFLARAIPHRHPIEIQSPSPSFLSPQTIPPNTNTSSAAGKAGGLTTSAKAPAVTDNTFITQDPDAVLAALEWVIIRATRIFARPYAPAITSISIALRELQDDAPAVDQEVVVRVYMPFDTDNNGASYRRVEAELRNLQPEEMESFLRLVDRVSAEKGGHERLERESEQNRANHRNHKGEASKLNGLRKIAGDQDIELAEARIRIAELERDLKQRDDEREDDEIKTSKLETLEELLDQANVKAFKEKARNAELKEELAMYRCDPEKRPLASLRNRDDDDGLAEETDERGADDAEDDAPTFDYADDLASFVTDAKATKKPGSHASSKLLQAKQGAKGKISRDDSAESEGGISNPICITSGDETDSDTEDDD